ncbi:MAG: restriction endonuclease subunit S [Prevotella sp.]|nr:restriction endonuclease subunit S [Prevotella sp.]
MRFQDFDGEWETSRLDSCVDFLDNLRKPIEEGNRIKGIYPYYGASGIVDYVNDYIFVEELILLSEDGANITDRNYPVCFLASGKYWVNNHAHVLKAKDGFVNCFVSNAMERKDYSQYNTGMAMPKLNKEVCKNIPLTYPLIEEQQSIASFFTTIDAQISASTSRLASLKQIKAASLQAMFPQEGETVPKLRFKGFEGEWENEKIGNFSSSFSGGTPAAGVSKYYGGVIPFIRSGEIHEDKTELFLTEKGYNNSSAKIVDRGTLLYALYGATSGDVAISKIKGAINQAILAIIPYKSVEKVFLANFLLCNKDKIVGELLQGGQGNLSGSLVKNIIVAYPSISEQRAIASYFTNLDRQITLQAQRLEKLKQIKAACLDKMFV